MSAGPASQRTVSRVVFFVFVTVFLDLVGFGIVMPLMPFYVKTMGGNAQTVGFLLAGFSLLQALATAPLGRLSDRIGRRPVILVSLAGNAAAMVIFAFATHLELLPLLFLSRLLGGATAGNLSACQAAITDVCDGEERTKGMGRLGAGIGLGLMLGPVIGGQLSHFGPWVPPIGAAAMALADLIGAFFLMPETRRAPALEPPAATIAVAPKPSLAQVLAQPQLLIVLGLYFLTFLAMTNLQVALALLVDARFGWGKSEVGYLFGIMGLLAVIIQGGLIVPLSRAFGQLSLVLGGAICLGIGMALIGAAHQPWMVVGGLVFVGSGLGVTNPLLSVIASQLSGAERRGVVLGFAQSSGGLARTVGPLIGGFLFSHVSAGAPFFGGAGTAGVSACLVLFLRRLVPAAPTLAPVTSPPRP
jgi:DHA1 family tetracycline resistance protein-like MFS transporter